MGSSYLKMLSLSHDGMSDEGLDGFMRYFNHYSLSEFLGASLLQLLFTRS